MNPIQAVMGALKYMPATLARKALTKVSPGFNNYFAKALSYGIDADTALNYLSDRFESEAQRTRKQQLQQGEANRTLRPDEMLSKSEMHNQSLPGNIVKGAASIGTGLALGGLGEGAAAAAEQLGEEPSTEPHQAQSPFDIISQFSPELAKFMEGHISKGRSPIEAGALAETDANFKDPIAKIRKSTGKKWSQFLEELFGSQQRSPVQQRAVGSQQLPQQGPNRQQILDGINQLSKLLQTPR